MSRSLHLGFLLGCLTVGAITAGPAWTVLACPAPLAALTSGGCELRLASRLVPDATPLLDEPTALNDLALIEAR
ncbi:MAG: hypothetical protein ABGY71_12755 [bacterium]|nr:hypothetical protein [Planctomycetota bacterium]HIL52052.1 hypothetical protein [Planctomycetota bacterium]